MTHHEYIYKAVVALNNTGVHLVQHGLTKDAIETLKDAIRFMKESLVSSDGSKSDGKVMNLTYYDKALQAAWHRKSHINQHIHQLHDSDINTSKRSILVVSDQDHPMNLYGRLEHDNETLRCITIDPVERFDMANVDRLQTESAIILYNLATAYRCISNKSNAAASTISTINATSIATTTSTRDVSHTSYQIMELSHSVTAHLFRVLSLRRTRLVNVPSNLLLVSFFIYDSLREMSIANDVFYDRHEYYIFELERVLVTISNRDKCLIAKGFNTSRAAAA